MKSEIKNILFAIIATLYFGCMACNLNSGKIIDGSAAIHDSLNPESPLSTELDSTIYETISDPSYFGQTFTIIFYSLSNNPQGMILGCTPGETRLFYYKAPIKNTVINDHSLSFEYLIQDEFSKPFTYENYNIPFENDTIGWNKHGIRLSYNGRISGDSLILACSSENNASFYECFRDTLKFIRVNKKTQ